ncbi:sulfotransferase family protein [Synechococcus sp. Ace-Pa]|nr:sulfotransferase family protein [Synechococcus sp. Ace-Pa]
MTQDQLRQLRTEYLDEVDRKLAGETGRMRCRFAIDKMPTNFRYLGLIRQIFPDSRILHGVRDPRDVAASCLEQNLAWPFCAPTDLAIYIQQHQRIMRHASAMIGDELFTLHCESLIASTKSELKSLFDFLGLPWQEECLLFHRSKRAVSTPSKQQVRQPIHSGSVGKWRRYADFAEKFFESIKPSSSNHGGDIPGVRYRKGRIGNMRNSLNCQFGNRGRDGCCQPPPAQIRT